MVVGWACAFLARALRRVVQLPALLCCEGMVWSVTFLAFPIRMLSAMERERTLGGLIAEMREQMDGLVCENRELEERLQAALKEQDALEALLDEMEEEHEDAFARIDVLERQLKLLEQENMRLNEHKGKAKWDKQPEDAAAAAAAPARRHGKETDDGNDKRSWKEAAGAGGEGQDACLLLDPSSYSYPAALTTTTPPPGPSPMAAAACSEEDDAARQLQEFSKAVARRRSLFSLGMSLAVGAVAWAADALCLPLLAGLFAVVGVSMRSVSALRRGGDAVALLSLNWFLLGVLTSPMLPGVVRALVPLAGRTLRPALTWFAATAPVPL